MQHPDPMNKKQRLLTIVAMAVFSAIIALHYGRIYPGDYPHTTPMVDYYKTPATPDELLTLPKNKLLPDFGQPGDRVVYYVQRPKHWELQHYWEIPGWIVDAKRPAIKDVRMPLFVLAVFYAGFFFILATPRAK
jgi:hypothetical protein